MKKRTLGANKKGYTLATEIIIIPFTFIIIITLMFLTQSNASATQKNFEDLAPTMPYHYPCTFIHTFLQTPITKDDKKELDLDITQNYFIKDLIIQNTDKSKAILETKRKEYIEKYAQGKDSSLSYYLTFSQRKINDIDKLLCIFYDDSNTYSLNSAIDTGNYFFPLRTKDKQYAFVRFNCG